MKISYTKGHLLFTVSLLVALLGFNFGASAACATVTPTVTNLTCNGAHNGAVSLSVTGGTPSYTYSWVSSTGFTSTDQNISGLDSGSYTVTVTESGGCSIVASVVVSQPSALSAAPQSNAPFCPHNTLILFPNVAGGTPGYSYSWSGPQGFTSTDASPSIPDATAIYDSVFSVTVTDANGCPVTAATSVVLFPSPVINLPPVRYLCAGGSITLDAGNPGSTYSWSTGASTQVITVSTVDTYSVTATNFYSCSESDTVVVLSSPYVTPTDTITASQNNICAGTPVTFTANITYGGDNPAYVWRKNGVVVGTSSDTYTDATLADGDRITNRLTSNFPCALPTATTVYSDTIVMHVTASSPTAVTISHLPDTACSGTPATFTAIPVNGGSTPYFQWLQAGAVVGTGNTFIYSPTGSDTTITVQMVSSLVCHNPDTATATATFVVYPHLVPSASISFTPNDTVAFIGAITTFFCAETYGGPSPTYQWYVDRVPVPGATNSSYARHVYDNDTVKCIVTSSALCAIPKIHSTNSVIIQATFLDVNDVNAGSNLAIFPNPTNGNLTLTGTMAVKTDDELQIEIRDLKGSVVYRKNITSQHGKVDMPLSLSGQLADGLYLMKVTSDVGEKQLKLIINK